MATRMIQRRGTSAEWTAANPVLAAGEIGFETDTTKFKFGDGVTAWADITYFASADALIDGAPELLDTLNELAAALGDDENFITTINTSISTLETSTNQTLDTKSTMYVSESIPSPSVDLLSGDLWYDISNGKLYVYKQLDESNLVWVESGSNSNVSGEAVGTDVNNFPTAPSNGDTHNGYIYDSTRTAWINDRTTSISDNADVTLNAEGDDDVLMYNSTSGEWENVPGVRLDGDVEIPVAYLAKALEAIRSTATATSFVDLETEIAENTTLINNEVTNLVDGATSLNTLGAIETYLNEHTVVKSSVDWGTDTSTPVAGSLNVETGGSEIKIKIGNGTDTYANLDYVPTNGSVASDIASAIAPLATKASPSFTGTVSLPATTSIGDVSDAEIAHLDGVTSGIQGQLDDLDTLKAPIADPTFTGTVSGVSKAMVGLGNVDNTADADKPVSTATQTALDAKAALSGASFTGNVVIGGNLTVSGETVTVSASDLSVRDNMIYLNQAGLFDLSGAAGDGTNVVYTTSTDHDIKVGDYITVTGANPASFDLSGEGLEVTAVTATTITVASTVTDTYVDSGSLRGKSHANPDLGWAAGRYDTVNGSGYGHAGIFRDASDGVFKFFDGYVPEPDESVFIDTSDASFALAPLAVEKMVFPDGTEQTAAAVPSLTTFTEKTADYQLDTLDHKDNIVEMNMSTAGTFTVPLDATLAWPVGASMDIFATGTGEITIAGEAGVTLNATPGLTLRTQWSSATIMKRGANNWVVYGDLKA